MANFDEVTWKNIEQVGASKYKCWNCGRDIASEKAYTAREPIRHTIFCIIHICPYCNAPCITDRTKKSYPFMLPGRQIEKLPDNIKNIFDEARTCLGAGAYTATVMLLRKILMNIAVTEGAEENLKFFQYVEYLCSEGVVHKRQKKQAEDVKNLGNAANHEIESRTKEDAEKMLSLISLILTNNYELADEVEK